MSEGCLGSFLEQKFSNASAGLSEACETRSACRSLIPATTRRSKKTTIASRSYRAMVRIVRLGTNGCQLAVATSVLLPVCDFCQVAFVLLNNGPKFPGRSCRDWCQAGSYRFSFKTARFCHNATFWRSNIKARRKVNHDIHLAHWGFSLLLPDITKGRV